MSEEHNHGQDIQSALLAHLPYAIFSVACALILLSVVSAFSADQQKTFLSGSGGSLLFHSFHFMHILFASTSTIIMFSRFSSSIVKALLVGIISPTFFCVLSDAFLPYLAGRILGVTMQFHLCLVDDFYKVIPFLSIGIINGMIISRYYASHKQRLYSLFSHTGHILISSLASTFYLVSHGLTQWYNHIGIVFFFLIIVVVVPCTLSDVIVPILFATAGKTGKK